MTEVAATETFTGTRGMSHCGRKYAFSVSVSSQAEVIGNGKYLLGTGRLANHY
jgi:hypothetical protein